MSLGVECSVCCAGEKEKYTLGFSCAVISVEMRRGNLNVLKGAKTQRQLTTNISTDQLLFLWVYFETGKTRTCCHSWKDLRKKKKLKEGN